MVKRGEYNYFIHPITDGVPGVEPALLRDVCSGMLKMLDLNNVDKIAGIPCWIAQGRYDIICPVVTRWVLNQ